MTYEEVFDGQEYGLFIRQKMLEGGLTKTAIVENLLYERDVVCVSAKPGIGKSILALQLMACLSSGTPFLETFKVPAPCNVLYIQTEGDRTETVERLDLISKTIPVDYSRLVHLNLPGARFNIAAEMDQLIAMLKGTRILFHVIIIDPLYTTVQGSMNKDEVVTDWIRNVRKLKGALDVAIWVNGHDNKDVYTQDGGIIDKGSRHIYGSTYWSAFFNHNYHLKSFDGHYILDLGKERTDKMVDRVRMQLLNTNTLVFTPYDPQMTENDMKVAVLLKTTGALPVKKIVELTTVPQASVYRALRGLLETGKVLRDDSAHVPTYTWKADPSDEKTVLDKPVVGC